MLTTLSGIIVFIAHVMTLDTTAAYANHVGHSVFLRNSMPFPCLLPDATASKPAAVREHEHIAVSIPLQTAESIAMCTLAARSAVRLSRRWRPVNCAAHLNWTSELPVSLDPPTAVCFRPRMLGGWP